MRNSKTVSPLAVLDVDSCSQRLFSLAKTATDSVEDWEYGILHHGYQRRGHHERAKNKETITLRNFKHFFHLFQNIELSLPPTITQTSNI